MKNATQVVWDDLNVVVCFRPTEVAPEHVAEFEVFTIFGFDSDGKLMFGDLDDGIVASIDEARPYLHGSLKWDGCSNIHFDEQDQCMLHFCGREGAGNVGRILERIYDVVGPSIPAWNP